jgi:nucleoside-diphosphate-sugar epimerase
MKIRIGEPAIKHVVIGSGPLGRATANALANNGHDVVIVNRSGKMDACPTGVQVVAGDLNDPTSLDDVAKDAAAIYFCAQPPYHRWVQEFPALQEAAINLAEQSGALLVVAENLYGYGPVNAPMTEKLPLRPNTRKGKVRTEMHQSLMAAHDAERIQVAIARGSDFFGPYVDGSAVGARAFSAMIKGKAVDYTGDIDSLHSYTYVLDFGAALATLGTDPRAIGEVWHVPNAPTVTSRIFFEKAFRLSSNPPKFRKMGLLEMKLLGMFIPPLKEMVEMVYEFEKPFVVDHSKFAAVFSDISTPLEMALEETVSWTLTNAK